MKISKSKQELARIISENGGWFDGAEWAAQCKSDVTVSFYSGCAPYRDGDRWCGDHLEGTEIRIIKLMPNWHQTILSREEYFHLYPAPDAEPRFCESVMRSIPGLGINSKNININITQVDDINAVESKPTIEQLAADYRNAKDCADSKQQEADDAKADADARLKTLELAGEAIGLLVTPITARQGPEMVIAVQVGDEVECIKSNINPGKYVGRIGTVSSVDVDDTSTPYLVDFCGEAKIWCHEVKFIRRP